jgi:hypothetical protein
MAEFKDAIRAAGGKLEYLHQSDGRLAFRISGDMRALYMVAVSLDGLRLLDTVPAVGYGQMAVYPQPSVVAYVQSDEQGMWGRNYPACERYFMTTHIFHTSVCPYCAKPAPSLAFIFEGAATLHRCELRRLCTCDADRQEHVARPR